MEPTNADSTRKLLLWCAPIVLGHFVAVIWHLFLLVKVQPSTPRLFPPLLILFNLFPVAGLVVLGKGFRKLAGSMIILPLALALVIGTYAHFLSPGTDNIFHMTRRGCVEYVKENGVGRSNWSGKCHSEGEEFNVAEY